jgi:hypothetical protein
MTDDAKTGKSKSGTRMPRNCVNNPGQTRRKNFGERALLILFQVFGSLSPEKAAAPTVTFKKSLRPMEKSFTFSYVVSVWLLTNSALKFGFSGQTASRPPFSKNGLIVKCHFGIPDFPNPAHQIRSRLQYWFTGFPAGGRGLCTFVVTYMLEGLNLPDAFHDVSSHRRGKHFKSLNDPVGINDKPTAGFYSGIFKIDAECAAYLASTVGKHGEGNTPFDHFGEFMIVPHFVDKNTVHAHGENFHA